MGQIDKQIEWLNKSVEFCHARNESYARLAEIYLERKHFSKALQCTKMLVDLNRKNQFPNLQFIIEDTAYYDTSEYPKELHTKALRGLNG
jgi:tetratricopeptide (TPR) repeat protein